MTNIDLSGGQVRASGVTVKLSNTGKVLFPDDGITKGELIEYYGHVADWMLPYLRDRPIAMARFPDGITRPRIFQKNPAGYYPDWVTTVEVKKQGGTLHHVVCDKAATLAYLANQACIEFHVFLTVRTMGERLAGTPDPWAGMSRHRYDVAATRRRLASL